MNTDWSMSIIMPHRPLSSGHLTTPTGPLFQAKDGKWQLPSGVMMEDIREDIYRGIHFINKNSAFKHTIIVAIDSDVHPQKEWLAEFPNVRIVQSSYVLPDPIPHTYSYYRLAAAYRDAIATVSDMSWICYGYTSDIICAKNWDLYIWEAAQRYGEDHVYVPMFCEVKTKEGTHMEREIKGETPTPYSIWVEYREKICCHGLTIPQPEKEHFTEEDFDEYIAIARRGHAELGISDVIFEPCGNRSIGYYNVLCMRAKYAKIAGFKMMSMGFDLAFDDGLRDKAHRMKGVVTDSYVLHPQSEWYDQPFQWEGISPKWKRTVS